MEIFVKKLCDELHFLKESGFVYEETRIFIGRIMFICDAPARAFLQCVKGHSAYNACAYCRIVGSYHEGRVIFPDGDFPLRVTESYQRMEENNQIRLSPLSTRVSLCDDFPPEYMHSVCLGVVRKIFKAFFYHPKICACLAK
jgi:hypothetical protein